MKTKLATALLILLGTIRVFAEFAGLEKLSAAAAVTNAAPAMKVFTAHQGYETFSPAFQLQLRWQDGVSRQLALDPAVYRRIKGPYNRRNMYGATLAYGPVLSTNEHTKAMWRSVADYAFCNPGVMLKELGLEPPDQHYTLVVTYQSRDPRPTTDFPTTLEVQCD